jgi:S1-C subfamily serine protease
MKNLRNGVLLLLALMMIPALLWAQEGETQTESADSVRFHHVKVIEKVKPAVVGITASGPASQKYPRGANFYGTGTILSEDGYVLTSITVVPSICDKVEVILPGGEKVPAELKGTVDEFEISILKIDRKGLPFVPLGNSSNVKLGDQVYTFGNCFHSIEYDDQVSISTGVVSGKYELGETNSESVYTGPCIETTAALNPGVDGGPLVDANGKFVGLLCLNYSQARWLGTAIPVNEMRKGIYELMDKGAEVSGAMSSTEMISPKYAEIRALEDVVVALTVDRAKDIPRRQQQGQQGRQETPEAKALRTRPKEEITGVIISEDGYVLTSWYNIAGELNGIKAHLNDGRSVDAEVVGWDRTKDVALLKIEAEGLPTPKWAKDHDHEVGDVVFCLGRSPNPENMTLSQGIISATGRLLGTALQLEAKVNYGNAGGPIVNTRGEIIGINCHVSADASWGQSSGIGFASTWTKIQETLADMKAGKKLDKAPSPFLGVQFDLEAVDVKGCRISRVVEDSAASEAGVEVGDIIIAVNGVDVTNPTELGHEIRKCSVGDEIVMRTDRDGEILELKATLGTRPN